MVQDQVEGVAETVVGRVQDAVGGLTGDTSMQSISMRSGASRTTRRCFPCSRAAILGLRWAYRSWSI